MVGGSVEHMNEEPGQVWMERITRTYPPSVWLNPVPEHEWDYTHSIRIMRQLMGNRMYPLTLEGSTARCGNWCGSRYGAASAARRANRPCSCLRPANCRPRPDWLEPSGRCREPDRWRCAACRYSRRSFRCLRWPRSIQEGRAARAAGRLRRCVALRRLRRNARTGNRRRRDHRRRSDVARGAAGDRRRRRPRWDYMTASKRSGHRSRTEPLTVRSHRTRHRRCRNSIRWNFHRMNRSARIRRLRPRAEALRTT